MASFLIGPHQYSAVKPSAGLYVVSTPIGNLSDITIRALEILSTADVIACEDTRTSAKLLNRYGISAKRVAYTEHNAEMMGPKLLDEIDAGGVIALISDAGTPLVSDPGQRLVSAAKKRNIPVFPVPGASAPIAALTASGLSTDRFTFAGFLPSKKAARLTMLESFRSMDGTLVFFESPSRLSSTLTDMMEVFGPDKEACVCREITKLHEESRHASLSELSRHYASNPVKGEIVIVVEPAADDAMIDPESLLTELLETNSVSRAASEAARLTGLSKRELYQRALALNDRQK